MANLMQLHRLLSLFLAVHRLNAQSPQPTPDSCTQYTSRGCFTCDFGNANCGWCSMGPHSGYCVEGNQQGPKDGLQCGEWDYYNYQCPSATPTATRTPFTVTPTPSQGAVYVSGTGRGPWFDCTASAYQYEEAPCGWPSNRLAALPLSPTECTQLAYGGSVSAGCVSGGQVKYLYCPSDNFCGGSSCITGYSDEQWDDIDCIGGDEGPSYFYLDSTSNPTPLMWAMCVIGAFVFLFCCCSMCFRRTRRACFNAWRYPFVRFGCCSDSKPAGTPVAFPIVYPIAVPINWSAPTGPATEYLLEPPSETDTSPLVRERDPSALENEITHP